MGYDPQSAPVTVGQPLPLDASFYQRYKQGKVKVITLCQVYSCTAGSTCHIMFRLGGLGALQQPSGSLLSCSVSALLYR